MKCLRTETRTGDIEMNDQYNATLEQFQTPMAASQKSVDWFEQAKESGGLLAGWTIRQNGRTH